MKKGRVLSILGQRIVVDDQGTQYDCVLRGILKKEHTRRRNLVIVGDIVAFEEGAIHEVEKRYSLLSRLSKNKQHLIAANIDQVLITVSATSPSLKPTLIDRYIIATDKGNMKPIIVLNKIDLANPVEIIEIYQNLGYTVLPVSAEKNIGLDALIQQMQGKASVFSGQSGVGKSSLINATLGMSLPTGTIVERTQKGAHITTRAQLIPLEGGGWCIDTPGIKSFGIWDLDPGEIESYFTEIHTIGEGCRFANCSHTHEPDCAVRPAVDDGRISTVRYHSYCSLLQASQTNDLKR